MGRGAQAQTRQLTDQQLGSTNALNQQFTGQQQQIGNLLLSQYQNILNNPGLSAADQAAVTGNPRVRWPVRSIPCSKRRRTGWPGREIPPGLAS